MSIHCNAKKEDIEKNVLMPGDPLRAKYIAENFLENARLVNTVRNMLAYTGTYKGKPVTVFSSGMGMPSIGIYSYELYKFYDVEKIIRIGSCGTYNKNIHLFDTILVDKSYTEGNFAYEWNKKEEHVSEASKELNDLIESTAQKMGIKYVRGNAFCNDCDGNRPRNATHHRLQFWREKNRQGEKIPPIGHFVWKHRHYIRVCHLRIFATNICRHVHRQRHPHRANHDRPANKHVGISICRRANHHMPIFPIHRESRHRHIFVAVEATAVFASGACAIALVHGAERGMDKHAGFRLPCFRNRHCHADCATQKIQQTSTCFTRQRLTK